MYADNLDWCQEAWDDRDSCTDESILCCSRSRTSQAQTCRKVVLISAPDLSNFYLELLACSKFLLAWCWTFLVVERFLILRVSLCQSCLPVGNFLFSEGTSVLWLCAYFSWFFLLNLFMDSFAWLWNIRNRFSTHIFESLLMSACSSCICVLFCFLVRKFCSNAKVFSVCSSNYPSCARILFCDCSLCVHIVFCSQILNSRICYDECPLWMKIHHWSYLVCTKFSCCTCLWYVHIHVFAHFSCAQIHYCACWIHSIVADMNWTPTFWVSFVCADPPSCCIGSRDCSASCLVMGWLRHHGSRRSSRCRFDALSWCSVYAIDFEYLLKVRAFSVSW